MAARSPARSRPTPALGDRSPSPASGSHAATGPTRPAHRSSDPASCSSMSAWATHRRSPDSAIPKSLAIRAIGFSRNRASSTARRRNSGSFGAGIADSSPRRSSPQTRCPGNRLQVSTKPTPSDGPPSCTICASSSSRPDQTTRRIRRVDQGAVVSASHRVWRRKVPSPGVVESATHQRKAPEGGFLCHADGSRAICSGGSSTPPWSALLRGLPEADCGACICGLRCLCGPRQPVATTWPAGRKSKACAVLNDSHSSGRFSPNRASAASYRPPDLTRVTSSYFQSVGPSTQTPRGLMICIEKSCSLKARRFPTIVG